MRKNKSSKNWIIQQHRDPYFKEEQWRESATDTCVIQVGGPGLDQWNVDELSVITNMTVEGGLMTGMIEPCQPIVDFLEQRRGPGDWDAHTLVMGPPRSRAAHAHSHAHLH